MENSSLKYIVYCTTCTINKKIYIGVHRTDPQYYDYYIGCGVYQNNKASYARGTTLFQRAVKKYGVNSFIRSTIAIFDNEEDAYALESDIVNELFLQRTDVYNVAVGGRYAVLHKYGIPLYQYDEQGNFIAKHDSINGGAKAVHRSERTLTQAIMDKRKCAGYFWSFTLYSKLDITKMHSYNGKRKLLIFQYSSTGEYDCCYNSIRDAERVTGISSASISRAVKLNLICNDKYFTDVYVTLYKNILKVQKRSYEVHQYDLQGNYIASYKNGLQASKALGVKTNIYVAIKLKLTVAGYLWSFDKLDKLPPIIPKSGRQRKVGKYDKEWNLLIVYNTLADAKRTEGNSIEHVLRGRNEFSKGYRYKFIS